MTEPIDGSVREMASTLEQATDRSLMSDFLRRDPPAAEELLDRFAPTVFGIGMRVFEDPEVASELVERTFVRLWRLAPRFVARPVSLEMWVLCQALSTSLQMSRARGVDEPDHAPVRSVGAR